MFKKEDQKHEIAATGIVKMSAISAGNHFTFIYVGFVCFAATLDAKER